MTKILIFHQGKKDEKESNLTKILTEDVDSGDDCQENVGMCKVICIKHKQFKEIVDQGLIDGVYLMRVKCYFCSEFVE